MAAGFRSGSRPPEQIAGGERRRRSSALRRSPSPTARGCPAARTVTSQPSWIQKANFSPKSMTLAAEKLVVFPNVLGTERFAFGPEGFG